jgi:iron(III) transport system substrate-binding protein
MVVLSKGRGRFLAAVVLTSALGLAACGNDSNGGSDKKEAAAAADAKTVDALYKLAKAEGEVEFWGPLDPPYVKAIGDEFNKTYPGIKVTSNEITAGDMIPKIIAQDQAHAKQPDVLGGSLSTFMPAYDRGLLTKRSDWGSLFDLGDEGTFLDGAGLAFYNNVIGIVYNTDLVTGDDVPKTFEDLLDPKWKGKIIMEQRGKAFSVIGMVNGKDAMLDYIKQFNEQEPKLVDGGATVLQQLAAGAGAIGLGAYTYDTENYKADGAPLEWVMADPTAASQFVLSTPKGAAHPAAAALFAGWLASAPGQAILKSASGHSSVLPGSGSVEADRIANSDITFIYENEENANLRAEMEEAAEEELGKG